MSIAVRTKRTMAPVTATTEESAETKSLHPMASPHDEAPDRGDERREAAESSTDRTSEAPEAGTGRAGLIEEELSHGRSRS